MKNPLSTSTCFLLLFASLSLSAAVPLKWTVETSRVQPAVFEAYHGETLQLEASLMSYGQPVADSTGWNIYWQTNGMASAYWSAPAYGSGNRVLVEFTPEMDPGASVVSGFLGQPGENYRAAFTIRFRNAPGANPAVLPPPEMEGYYTKSEIDELFAEHDIDVSTLDIPSEVEDAIIGMLGPNWRTTYGGSAAGLLLAVLVVAANLYRNKLNRTGGTMSGDIKMGMNAVEFGHFGSNRPTLKFDQFDDRLAVYDNGEVPIAVPKDGIAGADGFDMFALRSDFNEDKEIFASAVAASKAGGLTDNAKAALLSDQAFKTAVEAVFDNGETEAF